MAKGNRARRPAGRWVLGDPATVLAALRDQQLDRLKLRTLLAVIVLEYAGTEFAEQAQALLDDDLRTRGPL